MQRCCGFSFINNRVSYVHCNPEVQTLFVWQALQQNTSKIDSKLCYYTVLIALIISVLLVHCIALNFFTILLQTSFWWSRN